MFSALRRNLALFWSHVSEAVLWLVGRRRPYGILKIELSGDLAEGAASPRFPFSRARSRADYLSTLATLRYAADDVQLRAVYVKCDGLRIGWAKVQELRRALARIRKQGKPVWVHLTQPGIHEYAVASVADHVSLPAASGLDIAGLSSEVMFVAGALQKLGVQPEVVQLGKYKSAGESFTRSSMSPAHREMVESLMEDLYDQTVQAVAAGRGLDAATTRGLLDDGPFSAAQAFERKLVDALQYDDEAEKALRDQHDNAAVLEQRDYLVRQAKLMRRVALRNALPHIGILHVVGTIKMGDSMPGADGLSATGVESMQRDLNELRDRDDIRCVVLRVASPGGSGLASDLLWHELRRIRERKPIVVSFGDVAASGGYYIGMAGHPVLAEDGTITGSIGVLAGKPVLRGLYERLGVTKEVISQGKHAALHSDYLPLGEEDRRLLEEHARQFYTDFVDKVAAGRSMPAASVDAAAQGRVWTGRQAKQRGLIDRIGGLQQALEEAKVLAGFGSDAPVLIENFPRPRRLWRLPFALGNMQSRAGLLAPWWQAMTRERLWAILPIRLRFF